MRRSETGTTSAAPVLGADRPRPWDWLRVATVVLLAAAPIIGYAWVAIDAEIGERTALALDRNLSTAQLAAGRLDQQCEKILAAMRQAARAREPASDSLAVLSSLTDVSAVVAAGPDGRPTTALASSALRAEFGTQVRWLTDVAAGKPVGHVRIVRRAEGSTIYLAVPRRTATGTYGSLVAALPCARVDAWLSQVRLGGGVLYIADSEGHIIAASGRVRNRDLPLGDYPPMKMALAGGQGALTAPSPDAVEPDTLIGYAYAAGPRCGVLATQPILAALAPTNYLLERLSLLLLPLLLVVTAWTWNQLRYGRSVRALAAALTAQNEGLRAADRARAAFLGNVSHDLRTPLAAMQVSISSLLEGGDQITPDQARDSMRLVSDEVQQLTHRVQNLLEMTRIEAGATTQYREPSDFTDLVAAALERVEPLTRGRRIETRFPDAPLMVDCDQAEMESVLVNLLENAAKYTPEGSPLHLEGGESGGWVSFSLRDEGPGIPAGEEARIFEKFYRSRAVAAQRGTGLGLAICKAIVEAHGGEIAARNAPGCGAEFRLRIPGMDKGPRPQESRVVGERMPEGSRT